MTHAHPAGLELRFRRLLARYPAAYRAQREDEMIATLMEAARPEQERPSTKDVLDLTTGAVRAHLRRNWLALAQDGVSAAALPAALLLVGLLGHALVSLVARGLAHVWRLDVGVMADPNRMWLQSLAYDGAPVLVAVVLAVALLAGKPLAVRAVAGAIVAAALAANLIDIQPYGLGATSAVVPGLLATLVAAAPSAAYTAERRLARPLVFTLVVLPVVAAAIPMARYLYLAREAGSLMVSGPDELLVNVSGGIFVLGLLLAAVLVARRARVGGVLGAVLLLIATAPIVLSVLSLAAGIYSSAPSAVMTPISAAVTLAAAAASAAAAIAVRRARSTPTAAAA